ncbi:MAG: transcriptional activator domain protein [Thermomicrobiales bacterium]|nr:transcriptional activator domain protein [Thermomicrobiales bacterium]
MQQPFLRIRLFGAIDLRYGDRSLPPLTSARAEALLAWLLLHRDAPQPRQRLAFMLWPDSTEPQARTNLRHVLHDLRRALPEADRLLEVTPRTLRWRPDAPFWLDVAAFEEALARAESGDADDAVAALREAVETYRGDLLDGAYDDGVLAERERLRTRYLAALERLATLLGDRGDHAQAISYAERILHHDPLNEAAYRLLMRLYHTSGQHAHALQIYHLCSATLERELGIAPSPATRDAYAALLSTEPDHAASHTLPVMAVGGPSLVGRAPEWRRLTTIWEDAERGRAQLVLVTGESGVGKTRLVEEFRSWAARRGAVTAVARSYASEGAMAFGTIVAWLRSAAIRSRLDRLERGARADLAPLLPELLPTPAADEPPGLPGAAQRQRLFDAAVPALLAAGGPLLLVADDIQWSDPDTLQFFHYLLRAEPDAPLLLAATARREEIGQSHPANALIAGLHVLDRIAEIEVGRLGRDDTVVLAAQLADRPLGDLAGDRLFRETEGNPLFVVEAVRSGWSASDDPGRISPKVQAVIEDRLAQLSEPARDLVGLAATIGREFSPDVLALASDADDETLVRGLDELWRRRIVREQGTGVYDFSHDKIREVAHLAVSPARRRHHYLRVASALETLHTDDPGPVSGQLAMHYERAGAVDEAIAWSVRAAEAAQRVYADAEAARLLDRARELLLTLPETPPRGSREMAILAALAASLGTAEGFASTRLAEVHRRAQTLAAKLGVELAPPLLRSQAVASLAGNDFPAAQRFGRELHARGERDADNVLLVESEYVLGIAAFWQGQFASAREHFTAAIDHYRPDERHAHLLNYGLDPKVICLSRLGNTLWFLGHADAAAEARDAALSLVEEIAHPYSKEVALVFAAHLALDMRDEESVRHFTAHLTAALGDRSWRPTLVSGAALAGFVEVLDGRTPTGIARIQQTLAETRGAQHAPGMQAAAVRVLLEACAVAGDARAGLAASNRALTMKASLWEAEARRQRAEYLAALSAPQEEVEAELARALATAHRQGARSLELRTAASIVRSRQRWGDEPALREARVALQAILADMPEGRGTRDVREAAALLG